VSQWRQALRVVGGEIAAVAQVRVQDTLPRDLAGFTGRIAELDRLRRARQTGDAVVISAIEGMAGVGKTQLAVHAGHLLHAEQPFDQVLFANLRGFHPDPTQPPADPGAVLDGFLRLLGMPGGQIPHDLDGRAAAYRDLLNGVRALIVLDNAATADQVRPLLPATAGCLTLITSRRNLADLPTDMRLAVDLFSPDEAAAFLVQAVSGAEDLDAVARICRRCGHLPLALSLIAGHIRNTPGWTLADHADRLDERHRDRRLDTGVETALALSYQDLPADRQRLFRLAALHPGQDFDAYAAAALTGADLSAARSTLDHLRRDHLLLPATAGRYTYHDLVRAYATGRADDEDRPADRRDALTRLFDHYLATAAAAMNSLHPAEAHYRPVIAPVATPGPDLTVPDTALAWLDAERPTLVAVAGHTADHGWPGHTTRLARILSRYLGGGHYNDALVVFGHAYRAALDDGDLAAQAHARTDLGVGYMRLGELGLAAEHFQQAVVLFGQTNDSTGARALFNLGSVTERLGRYPQAIDYIQQALARYRRAGDRSGEIRALNGIGYVMQRSHRFAEAAGFHREALELARQTDNHTSEAHALQGLGDAALPSGTFEPAAGYLHRALDLYRRLGDRDGQAGVLDSLGMLHTRLGRAAEAVGYLEQALAMFRETGDQTFEAWALGNLGDALQLAGRTAEALASHTAAHAIAAALGAPEPQAVADRGLGRAHHALGDHDRAREHYERALAYYAEAGLPEADEIRTHLADLDET
jgi:tetratricopeptide (TPR) repeat protein